MGALDIIVSGTMIAQTVRIRETIDKVDGNELSLKSNDGAQVKLTLTENAMIVAVVKGSTTDIKEGIYFGGAAMPKRATWLNYYR